MKQWAGHPAASSLCWPAATALATASLLPHCPRCCRRLPALFLYYTSRASTMRHQQRQPPWPPPPHSSAPLRQLAQDGDRRLPKGLHRRDEHLLVGRVGAAAGGGEGQEGRHRGGVESVSGRHSLCTRRTPRAAAATPPATTSARDGGAVGDDVQARQLLQQDATLEAGVDGCHLGLGAWKAGQRNRAGEKRRIVSTGCKHAHTDRLPPASTPPHKPTRHFADGGGGQLHHLRRRVGRPAGVRRRLRGRGGRERTLG